MDLSTPAVVKQVISRIDLDALAHEVSHARQSALQLGRSALGEARTLARRHPTATAAIAGGLGVLAIVGAINLISKSVRARD